MAIVKFKGKIETIRNMDDSIAWRWIKIPALSSRHCNMQEFRTGHRLSPYSNSDMFPGLLKREIKKMGISDYIKIDQVPAGVTIDESGFLAAVSISIN